MRVLIERGEFAGRRARIVAWAPFEVVLVVPGVTGTVVVSKGAVNLQGEGYPALPVGVRQ